MKKALALLLFSILLLSACGGTAQDDATAYTPTTSPAPQPSAAPEETLEPQNPIKSFYTAYRQETEGMLGNFYHILAERGDIDALTASFLMDEHCTAVSEISVSLARLSADGTSTSLIGAASGLGSISYFDETDMSLGCSFVFRYDNGNVMSGSFDGTTLSIEVNYVEEIESSRTDDGIQPEGAEDELLGPMGLANLEAPETISHYQYSIYLVKYADGYYSCVDTAEGRTALLITAEDARILSISLSEGESLPAYPYSQTLAGADLIYSFSSGLERF